MPNEEIHYLDKNGLAYLWAQMKLNFASTTAVSGKESTSNKLTSSDSFNSWNTDDKYLSSKAVYDYITAHPGKMHYLGATYNIATKAFSWLQNPMSSNEDYVVLLNITDGTNSRDYVLFHSSSLADGLPFIGTIDWNGVVYNVTITPRIPVHTSTIDLVPVTSQVIFGNYDIEESALTVNTDYNAIESMDFDSGIVLNIKLNDGVATNVIFNYVGVDSPDDESEFYFAAITNAPLAEWGEHDSGDSIFYNVISITEHSGNYINSYEISKKATTLAGYGITDAYTKTQTDAEIASAIASVSQMEFVIEQSLPASGEKGKIYLIPISGTSTTYKEYIWLTPTGETPHFEQIGTTDVDLSNYYTKSETYSKTEIDAKKISNAEIDTIISGS